MKTFKDFISEESIADRYKRRRENLANQELSRERDNEHIGNELAKHDINVIKFHPTVDSGDKAGTLKTKVSVDSADQDRAHKVIKSLGYGDTHHVSSPSKEGGRFERDKSAARNTQSGND